MYKRNNKAINIAKGGLFTAVGFIFIYISTFFPINKLYFLAIASCIIPLSVITTTMQNTIIVYIATTLLSLLICGVKIPVILYGVFFGVYGILKYYIEKLRKIHIEIILKIAFFNIILLILLYVYKLLFIGTFKINTPIYIFIAGCEIAFLIYDYILTIFISRINKFFN